MSKRPRPSDDNHPQHSRNSRQPLNYQHKRQKTEKPNRSFFGIPISISLSDLIPFSTISKRKADNNKDTSHPYKTAPIYPPLPFPSKQSATSAPSENGILRIMSDHDRELQLRSEIAATKSISRSASATPKNQIVDLTADSDDDNVEGSNIAGPSRQPSITPNGYASTSSRRPSQQSQTISRSKISQKPSRPLLNISSGTAQRDYKWQRASSTTSSTSNTSSRTLEQQRKALSEKRSGIKPVNSVQWRHASVIGGGGESKKPVDQTRDKIKGFMKGLSFRREDPKRMEKKFEELEKGGLQSKNALDQLLRSHEGGHKTLDTRIRQQPRKGDLSKQHKTQQKAKQQIKHERSDDISAILKDLDLEKEEEEAKVQAALRPRLPTRLKADEQAKVDQAIRNPAFKQQNGAAVVEAGSLKRLRPNTWLDDEVINFYGSLLQSRSNEDGKLPKIHYFNSFFYSKLESNGRTSMLARWTRKVDLFAKDLVIFPVNTGNMHWTAAVIDINNKRIEYYDSMGDHGGKAHVLYDNVLTYLEQEHQERKGSPLDSDQWTLGFSSETPRQNNGVDCGVFSCQTLEAASRGKDLINNAWEFSASDMPFFRQMMIYEVASGKLYKRW